MPLIQAERALNTKLNHRGLWSADCLRFQFSPFQCSLPRVYTRTQTKANVLTRLSSPEKQQHWFLVQMPHTTSVFRFAEMKKVSPCFDWIITVVSQRWRWRCRKGGGLGIQSVWLQLGRPLFNLSPTTGLHKFISTHKYNLLLKKKCLQQTKSCTWITWFKDTWRQLKQAGNTTLAYYPLSRNGKLVSNSCLFTHPATLGFI